MDGDGCPTNQVAKDAFADALSAQVEWRAETGDEPAAYTCWDSVKIGFVALAGPRTQSAGGAGRKVVQAAIEAMHGPDLTLEIFRFGAVATC
ncbi:hypothetical protein [Streptomyces spectabilis]|uniref:Uncharacterized protein n=1 Tax=Streptomyces spectabilis TaxID=68270 RepID=A0A516R3N7_STRST|nr:hypothetical protein [Streptomyces spectabilis]QDQ10273.1 hypothetical protein FH965_06620 [Streptomyces spectabilis]